MGSHKFKLYLPFIAIIVAQALLVVAAPSNAPGSNDLISGGFQPGAGDAGGDFGDDFGDLNGTDGGDGGSTTNGGGGQDLDVGEFVTADDGTTAVRRTGSGVVRGDISHCVGDRQFDILLNNPACIPKFEGDNGGATYQGVSGDAIRIVQWEYEANAAVDAALAPQGLATTPEDRRNLDAAAKAFIEKHYELYGRKLEVIRVVTSCPTSPQDITACKQEARRVIAMKPLIVIIGTVSYPEIYDEFARAGIITVGGWHWPASYFTQRRPYRWDLFMDGDQSAAMLAEYYCKKLAGKPASQSGRVIHPTIGGRTTPRKVGILAPDRDTDALVAETMRRQIAQCAGHNPTVIKYSPDINQASRDSEAISQRLVSDGVTTVICFCDPVTPIFFTKVFTRQSYFPEHLMSGTGLLDYDKLGRLYDQGQWVHAFGPGHLFDPLPFAEQDVSRMWRASGQPGGPCQACNLNWSYYALTASMIHGAGPNLNPHTVEAGLLSATPYGGDRPGSVLVKLGPGDYTVVSDSREAYWSANTISKIDGSAGAYVTMNNGARYEHGEWTNEFTIPAASQ